MRGRIWIAAAAVLGLAGCTGSQWGDALGGDCGNFQAQYQTELQASGTLLQEVPTTADGAAMALVLSQSAVNDLFARLGATELPELRESTTVLGASVGVSVRPSLPTLQIGGTSTCPDCFRARVPFDVGLDLAGVGLPRGAGAIEVQMPIRLIPRGADQTALVAQFQSIEVLGLDLSFREELARNIFTAVEPLVSRALTVFLQSRFEDAAIVTLDSWRLGGGQVALAGRGPFVFPEQGTIVVALQSNLPHAGSVAPQAHAQLPAGADVGIILDPRLLGAMGRRMLFEGVIPQSYDEQGQAQPGGAVQLTLASVGSSDDGLLRAQSTLWRTGSLCGAADIAASIGFSASPEGVSFAVRDVSVSNGRGYGRLLQEADQMAGGYLDALLATLEVTVNYGELFGGQAAERPGLETFQFNVDGRGISLFLDL